MSRPATDPARVVADNLNADPAISAELLLQKLVLRWKLILACALVAPLLALLVSHQIPTTYKSSAQILLRHQGGAQDYYKNMSTPMAMLSGASSAEVLRGDAVASRMIEQVQVEDADIARPAYKVIFGKVAALIMPLFGRDTDDGGASSNPSLKYLMLAKDLKPSVDASTLMIDRGGSVTRDELIEVTLKSTNREKVAAMVNGLCESFITEYRLRSLEDLRNARQLLDEKAAAAGRSVKEISEAMRREGQADAAAGSEATEGRALASGLARSVSDLELQLVELRQVYTPGSPEITRATQELELARLVLSRQQALDAARDNLTMIRRSQRELGMAAELLERGQIGLSIVEQGLTPKKTKLTVIMKYGVPAVGGLIAGLFIGLVGAMLLNILDSRVFVGPDAASASSLPLLGELPEDSIALPSAAAGVAALPYPGARPALHQALGKLEVLSQDSSRIVVVTSAENEGGSATVSLQLAALMARDHQGKVLLIDANFDAPTLTETLQASKTQGLLELLSGKTTLKEVLQTTATPHLMFLGTGAVTLRDEAGSNREGWSRLLSQCLEGQGTVVIHVGGLLNSREAAPLAKRGVRPVLVSSRRLSKRNALDRASALLAEIGVPALGIIHCAKRSGSRVLS